MISRIRDMWSLLIIAYVTTIVYAQQQNSRRPEPHDNGHGWDIRLAVPGQPGGDYPTLNSIPRTSFSCSRKSPGYYADVETGCQVFKVCTLGSTYGFQSFLCPNGTLFNQEVFVCDWWMNVNCGRSQQLFNENREKFGNLKLGPQLMKDIKKMLTHPVRNPYDKSIMKSNLIVMQEYKAPAGQLFPNGALISGPERPPTNIYIPSKQRQANFAQNTFIPADLSSAASTPSAQYVPSSFNSFETPRDVDILQQQRQPLQNSNSHVGMIRATNSQYINSNRLSQPPYAQNQNHNGRTQFSSDYIPNNQRQRQLSQYNSNINYLNPNKQSTQNGNSNPTQQFGYPSKQNGQFTQKNNIPHSSNGVNIGREATQNLINSNGIHPNGKTLKFSRIVQKSSSGNPKSRVTFKTWIVRPSKSARLVADPTPYSYDRPTNPPTDSRLVDSTVHYENPTTEKVNPVSENEPYVYNRPTPSSKQIIAIDETPVIYLPPTVATLSNQIYSTSKKPLSFKQSDFDLPPTTYKPASRFYVPPPESSYELSRQYLSPDIQSPEAINYQSSRLVATPTSVPNEFTTGVSKNVKTPSFSITKQSHINTNRNNLTFSDILTKEKLDITVNDIVKNTNEILKTATPEELNQYRQNQDDVDNLANNYSSKNVDIEVHDKKHTLQPSQTVQKSEKLIVTPSTELEPPILMANNNYEHSNRLLSLPFFKEPAVPTNTIERTVSFKITIPETIAEYLFKNHSEQNSDNLEILNTGSSNYLVLTNNNLDENNDASLIPIGRLIWDKNINVSNPHALVYSILADSINAVKEYNNIAKQNLISPAPTPPQTYNINNEDVGDITDKVSRLTASQFTKDDTTSGNYFLSSTSKGQYRDNPKHITEVLQGYPFNHQPNSLHIQQNPSNALYSSRLQRLSTSNQNIENVQNKEQIYSGQLYKLSVPEVTSKIYNSPNLHASQFRQKSGLLRDSQRNGNTNNIKKQSLADVELFPTESLPYPPVTQELPRTESTLRFNNLQDNYENANQFLDTDTAITAHVQDKITGSLPHPLEENKLVTYQKNKSYYLYTKLDEEDNDNEQATSTISQTHEHINPQNAQSIRNNNLGNRVSFELFPAIGYEIEDDREKQRIFNAFKINDFRYPANTARSENYDKRRDNLVTGVDFTILHPSSKKIVQSNNVNTLLYKGPSSYLAPQSSVGNLGGTQQTKINARIEQFDDTNGYSKTVPARQFSF